MIFNKDAQESFYQLIRARRDVRSNFLQRPVPKDVITRIIDAAQHAPSVAYLQPWNFILIESLDTRKKILDNFHKCRKSESQKIRAEKRALYDSLKLEGIIESPLNICVTCDRNKDSNNVLGQSTEPQMDIYSTVCAIQNMWLAARVENIGMGWVSILENDFLRATLDIPKNIEIIGYFCLGYVDEFFDKPELESKGWNHRHPPDIHYEKW